MKVAFLHHNPGGYIGGAELTIKEFAAEAPDGVEVVSAEPGKLPDADRYVIGNGWDWDRPAGFRYLHDMRGGFRQDDKLIFCSPLQRSHYGYDGVVIPPALNTTRFKPPRQTRRNGKRSGAVTIGQWQNPGKGQQLLDEWSRNTSTLLHVYGGGPLIPLGPNIDFHGEIDPTSVPHTLWKYETFVHLPTALEPFGRAVAEAWLAGCRIVTNELVGARHFIENDPDALESAAEDFWGLVCG